MANMLELASVSEKGQVTLPKRIRMALKIKPHMKVGFRFDSKGKVQLVPVEIKEVTPYTAEEWTKIENLANRKGRRFKSAKAAKKHLKSL